MGKLSASCGIFICHFQYFIYTAQDRLMFWTDPEVEIKLAADTGVTVFRMGLDWGRLCPIANINGIQDWDALHRYQEIIDMVRNRGMKVMLTLFHHSLPEWLQDWGWPNAIVGGYFTKFAKDVVDHLEVTSAEIPRYTDRQSRYRVWYEGLMKISN